MNNFNLTYTFPLLRPNGKKSMQSPLKDQSKYLSVGIHIEFSPERLVTQSHI